jgi:Ca-activated chloride channel family protein
MKLKVNLAKKNIKTKSGLNHIKIDIIPENRPKNNKPNCFIFVIDTSGSMNCPISYQDRTETISRIDYAKNAIVKFIDKLGQDDMIGIVSFSNFAKIEQELTEATKENKLKIKENIKNTSAMGGTNMEDGLNYSFNMLECMNKNNYSTKVILFSDGEANIGVYSPRGLGKIAEKMFENNIVVSTIGIGLGYDSEVMGAIATNGNGGMHHLENFDKFNDILEEEFEATSNIVATNVKLSISNFGLIQVCENLNRYKQEEVGEMIEIKVGNILRERSLGIEIKNDFELTDQKIKIELSYDDIEGNRKGVVSYLEVKVSDNEDDEENEEVVNYIKNILNADMLAQASGMYDSGNIDGVTNIMSNYRQNLSSLKAVYKSSDFDEEIVQYQSLSMGFQTQSISRSLNKEMYAKALKARKNDK